MKRTVFTLLAFVLAAASCGFAQNGNFDGCGSTPLQERLYQAHPELEALQTQIDEDTRYTMYLNPQWRTGDNPGGDAALPPVYTIPVVVHVVHFTGTPVGTAENISDAQVQAGIDHLNDAFRNIGAYNPLTGEDIEIEFCLAQQDTNGNFTSGIIRYANDAHTDLDMDTEDGSLKAAGVAKQWDATQYCNIWLVDEICSSVGGDCGTAGYAYFASSHGQPWDGIVNEAAFFGSSTNNSKVHIHEMGHYLNLYHTFQGGCTNNDCTADGDRCCDTPPDNSTAAVSCAGSANSCLTDEDDVSANNPFRPVGLGGLGDQNDMHQNYMDYGFQSCQDRFTADQRDRMRTALTTTRSSLLSSPGCQNPSIPAVFFATTSVAYDEAGSSSSGCRTYQDITVTMSIAAAPTGNADITINYAGTATGGGVDYTGGTAPEITFPSGGTSDQSFTIRIWDDVAIEGSETITLTYAISGATDAVAGSFNQTMTITLNDDDQLPATAGTTMLINEDFESGIPGSWTNPLLFSCPCTSYWNATTNGIPGSMSAHISSTAGGSTYDYADNGINQGIATPVIDATSIATTMYLRLYLKVDGNAGDRAEIRIRSFGAFGSNSWFSFGGAWSPLTNYDGIYQLTLPASLQGNTFEVGFFWRNTNDATVNGSPMAIDDVQVYIPNQQAGVETELCSQTFPFGPNETVYIYNGDENEIVAKLENLDAWDYGCTTVQIDRTGTGATVYQANGSVANFATDKTLLITPTNPNASGNYRITLYYEDAEISGYEAATGNSRNNAGIFKAPSAISTGQGSAVWGTNFSRSTYAGSDWQIEGEFTTGFSGFALGDLTNSPLPLAEVNFYAVLRNGAAELNWESLNEQNLMHYVVERSYDGIAYEDIATLSAQNKDFAGYEWTDAEFRVTETRKLYYRLRIMDMGGSDMYSEVRMLNLDSEAGAFISGVWPNPFGNTLNVSFELPSDQQVELSLSDLQGRRVYAVNTEAVAGSNTRALTPGTPLSSGVYFLRIRHEGGVLVRKLVKE